MPQPFRYPSVDVVVVNYNGASGGMLERCLTSVARTQYTNFRITVVDNGSTDGSTSLAQRTCPDAHLIRNDRNLGFAAAGNQAFRLALGNNTDYVAIVNDDVTFPNPQWLAVGIAAAEADPRVGIVGFRNGSQPGSRPGQQAEPGYVKYLHGCVLLIKATLIRLVGMFDERYFMYAEEDDLELRAAAAGFLFTLVGVEIVHEGYATSRLRPLNTAFLLVRNSIRCALKNHRPHRAVARAIKWLDISANPATLFFDPQNEAHRRVRGAGGRVCGLGLTIGAIAWNILWLPETAAAAVRDRYRLRAARRALAGSSVGSALTADVAAIGIEPSTTEGTASAPRNQRTQP
jgi:GT2 family glycosyltransferase